MIKSFPQKTGTKQRYSLSSLLLNMVLEILAKKIRKEKEIKSVQIEKKEINFSLFADDMIMYIEIPKGSIKKVLDLIN